MASAAPISLKALSFGAKKLSFDTPRTQSEIINIMPSIIEIIVINYNIPSLGQHNNFRDSQKFSVLASDFSPSVYIVQSISIDGSFSLLSSSVSSLSFLSFFAFSGSFYYYFPFGLPINFS